MPLPWESTTGCSLSLFLEEILRFAAQILEFLLWLSAKEVQMQPAVLSHSVAYIFQVHSIIHIGKICYVEILRFIQYYVFNMKTKKHIHVFILLAIFFIVIYIILAAKPLGKEYHFTPEWRKSISTPTVQNVPLETQQIYFKLGQSIGYFTEDGQITTFKTFPSKASISSE